MISFSYIDPNSLATMIAMIGYGWLGLTLITFSFYGWGRVIRLLAQLPAGKWPVTTALGLAAIVVSGGVVNVLRLAEPVMLRVIVIAGIALSILALWRDGIRPLSWRLATPFRIGLIPWCACVVALTTLMLTTQLAPPFYNLGDDLREYFPHVVRMIETGTLFGSPLNALGAEGVGGQQFLQGFVVAFLPFNFINSADSVFCFFLCLVLTGNVAFGRPSAEIAAFVAAVAVFMIDPQYVNTSSVYSTAAVVSALIIISVDGTEGVDPAKLSWRRAAVPALFSAAAIALKITGLIFVVFYVALSAAASYLATRDGRMSAGNFARVGLCTVVFVAPWFLLYTPYYAEGLFHPLGRPVIPVPDVREPHLLSSLFSAAPSLYGASELAYTVLSIALLFIAVLALIGAYGDADRRNPAMQLAAAAIAAAAAYFFWVLYGPNLQELGNTLRYSVPVLIGAVSAILCLWTAVIARGNRSRDGAALLTILALFVLPARPRLGTLIHQHSQLAYLRQLGRGDLARKTLTKRAFEAELAIVRKLQPLVPPGETIISWTATSFLLDYGRNTVVDVNVAGLSQAWAHLSFPRYVLWESNVDTPRDMRFYLAFGRRIGEMSARAIHVYNCFEQMADKSEKIADAGTVVLFRTKEDRSQPEHWRDCQ